ncbi:MAG: DNA-binding protein [Clostridiales bacterium]|jgi:predicted DNA-binding protein with PD1-like motif|nr:DNA-binding protein [Clostridiales bacterium]
MKVFTQDKVGRIFILRLDQGDFVLESINELIERENIKNGVVVSAIGTLDYCTLHMVMTTGYPPVEHFEKWEDKPLELASIDGIIADGVPHLHTVISDHEKAYAGHLEPGCRVLYLAEIVIMELEGDALTRIKNEKGINELHAK